MSGCPPMSHILRKTAAELESQISRVSGSYSGKRFIRMTRAQGMIQPRGSFGGHAVRKNIHHFATQGIVGSRSGDQLFASALIEGDGVKFISANMPPAG